MRLTSLLLVILMLGACAGPGYRDGDTCRNCGTVERIDRVYGGDGYASGSGALLGAIIGGALGNTVGKGDGRKAATVAGAVIGGAIGHEAEKDNNRGPRYELFLRMDDGRRVVIRQPEIGPIRDGMRVEVRGGRAYLL
jgi:outer membrane lipoprotein SlyB